MEISVTLDLMCNMDSQIKIFETGTKEGLMTRNKKFYDESFSQEKVNELFYKIRQNIGKKYGFKGEKMFQTNQKNNFNNVNYTDGKYVIISDKNLKKDDLWYENIEADILIISNKYKNIVVGNQMADCPIVIVEDRYLGVTALAHCGASYIDRKLPIQIIEALQKEFDSKIDNLYVYISSCIRKESYIYDKYPSWAKNKQVWNKAIIKKENNYYIDLVTAILEQLQSINIKNIEISPNDTATNPNFYSHSASFKGDKTKSGQNFVGFFYK